MRRFLQHILLLIPGAAAMAGCCLVDEDMTDCETEYEIRYEVRLVTNLEPELVSKLGNEADKPVAEALRGHLQDVFSDFAHDADLGFYDVVRGGEAGDSLRRHHGRHVMDGNESRFAFYLPVREYMHLVAANLADNGLVRLEEDGRCHASRVVQEVRDTVPSHRTGLFTARLPMKIQGEGARSFQADLYMANCATALVVDTLGSGIRKLDVYASGFATGFNLCDSTYIFQYTPYVKPDRLEVPGTGTACYAAVHFPSRDTRPATRTVTQTEAPFLSDPSPDPLWRYWVYATLPDGTVTQSRLAIYNPVRAGQLRIIRVKLYGNGSVVAGDPTVGVSVTMDWEPGMDYDITL